MHPVFDMVDQTSDQLILFQEIWILQSAMLCLQNNNKVKNKFISTIPLKEMQLNVIKQQEAYISNRP